MDRGIMIRAGKLLCILAGILLLILLWNRQSDRDRKMPAPEGEAVSREDVEILLSALSIDLIPSEPTEHFTYAQYKMLYNQVDGISLGLPDFADQYEDDHFILKEDWYQAYRILLAYLDPDSSIWQTTIFTIQLDTANRKLISENHTYQYLSSSFADSLFTRQEVYVKGDTLLTCVKVLDEETVLKNVWIMEQDEKAITCFYHQTQFVIPSDLIKGGVNSKAARESIADLWFLSGGLTDVETRSEKIRGKLLQVTDDSMEIDGLGHYETTDEMEIYKLYGSLETKGKTDLLIGYDVTDFVINDGKICACLISREEETTMIRVLLKNSESGSYYHEEVLIDVDGEQIQIVSGQMENGERCVFAPRALTDRVELKTSGIQSEDQSYRGSMEICQREDGLLIVNELPVEEYLYAVVPSEMPASYPEQALMAQAVCARTYAVRYILHAGLAPYGAHLDNTTSYQVYHNIKENVLTTTAVKETAGELLYYGGEPAQNYYYSTSCGYGTDAKIWKGGDADLSYMRSGPVCVRAMEEILAEPQTDQETDPKNIMTADMTEDSFHAAADRITDLPDMSIEENFAAFISSVGESDLEKDEPWYRWRYEVEKLNEEEMINRIKTRYQADPSLILTQKQSADENYYVSEEIGDIGEIHDIRICKRGLGGIAEEMLITGSKTTLKIISEYNIRFILCDGESRIIRQDNSPFVSTVLLPSAFFIMEVGKSKESVVGYTLIGGGYGHGVGMSQNAAKAMGNLGYGYRDILECFFTGCEVYRNEALDS